jgi:hypothetical protein
MPLLRFITSTAFPLVALLILALTMENLPIIQVLSKNNYEDQYMVSLPTASLPPLAESSLRVRTSILSLTNNNLTYARIGHLLGWWDIHPLPSSIPAEFSDTKQFGRISCWGYGVVIESTVSEVEAGMQVWGYLPIGTLPVDMQIQLHPEVFGQFYETSKHRAHVLPVYNRYLFYPTPNISQQGFDLKQSQGYDSLLQVLFETAYMINRFVFPWNPSEAVYPFGDGKDGWTFDKGNVDDKTIFILFAASGKTGLSLAYALKHSRPEGKKPRGVFAVGSGTSKAFTEGTGLYDKVMLYDACDSDLQTGLNLDASTRVIMCDFGARGGAASRWADKLRDTHHVTLVGVGSEPMAETPEQTTAKFLSARQAFVGRKYDVNASALRSQAMEILGDKQYFLDFMQEWNQFKGQGGIAKLRLVWGEGMGDVAKGWERLCKGEVGPDEGLVFSLGV